MQKWKSTGPNLRNLVIRWFQAQKQANFYVIQLVRAMRQIVHLHRTRLVCKLTEICLFSTGIAHYQRRALGLDK